MDQQQAETIQKEQQQEKELQTRKQECQEMATQAQQEKKLIQQMHSLEVKQSCEHQVLDIETHLKQLDSDVLLGNVGLLSLN